MLITTPPAIVVNQKMIPSFILLRIAHLVPWHYKVHMRYFSIWMISVAEATHYDVLLLLLTIYRHDETIAYLYSVWHVSTVTDHNLICRSVVLQTNSNRTNAATSSTDPTTNLHQTTAATSTCFFTTNANQTSTQATTIV
jgi:hypothetical protein